MDLFRPEFNRLKAKNPLPDFSNVVDVDNVEPHKLQHKIVKMNLEKSKFKPVCGFRPCEQWNVYKFPEYPGFIVIQNPFLDGYQRYWASRCLQDFSADKRNSTNLSNLGRFEYYDAWEDFVSKEGGAFCKDDPMWKLRWATLGYQYGWQTKEYSEDRKVEFPLDVQCLCQYISHCLGFGAFRAEAGIVNYYRLDSTLGIHTDHSELDHEAPLLSFSFGRSCVFLLGGPTKETKPLAVFLRDGDICVMSKEARLAYHAVPKILPPDVCPRISTPYSNCDDSNKDIHTNVHNGENNSDSDKRVSSKKQDACMQVDSSCKSPNEACEYSASEEYVSYIDTLNENIECVLSKLDWEPFEKYLLSSRINLNMRQVLPPGCEVVVPKEYVNNDSTADDGY